MWVTQNGWKKDHMGCWWARYLENCAHGQKGGIFGTRRLRREWQGIVTVVLQVGQHIGRTQTFRRYRLKVLNTNIDINRENPLNIDIYINTLAKKVLRYFAIFIL